MIGQPSPTWRRFLIPLVLAVVFLGVLVLVHDGLRRVDYEHSMASLGEQLIRFRAEHGRLPTEREFQGFTVESSRYLSAQKVRFEGQWILEESPPETVLAYTPLSGMWLSDPGRLVLYQNGETAWMKPAELEQQRQSRDQLYHERMAGPGSETLIR